MRGSSLAEMTRPARAAVELVASKWVVLVVYALAEGTLRHGELSRCLPGVSQKVLTQTLRRLEEVGMVRREVYATVPPRVEYTLTETGSSLIPIIRQLCRWAEENGTLLSARGSEDKE